MSNGAHHGPPPEGFRPLDEADARVLRASEGVVAGPPREDVVEAALLERARRLHNGEPAPSAMGGQPGGATAILAALVTAIDEDGILGRGDAYDAAMAGARRYLDGRCPDHDPPYVGLVLQAPLIDRLRAIAGMMPHGAPAVVEPGSSIATDMNTAANALELVAGQRDLALHLLAERRAMVEDARRATAALEAVVRAFQRALDLTETR